MAGRDTKPQVGTVVGPKAALDRRHRSLVEIHLFDLRLRRASPIAKVANVFSPAQIGADPGWLRPDRSLHSHSQRFIQATIRAREYSGTSCPAPNKKLLKFSPAPNKS
jgi:hypothetical protein